LLGEIEGELKSLGGRVQNEYRKMSVRMELEKPQLIHYDAFGHRIDDLVVSTSWSSMKGVSAREGFVGLGYDGITKMQERDKTCSEFARIYQYTKYLLWLPSSGLYGCPLAMTDGAAKLLYLYVTKPPGKDAESEQEQENFDLSTKKQHEKI
ncbi:hypothetical protein RFI_12439, partial [Reticulomyxa filosa]